MSLVRAAELEAASVSDFVRWAVTSKNSFVRKIGNVSASSQRFAFGTDFNWESEEIPTTDEYLKARDKLRKLAADAVNLEAQLGDLQHRLDVPGEPPIWTTGQRCRVLTDDSKEAGLDNRLQLAEVIGTSGNRILIVRTAAGEVLEIHETRGACSLQNLYIAYPSQRIRLCNGRAF